MREARQVYADPHVQRLAHAAAWVEKTGYCRWTRLEETIQLARRMDWTQIGIACCIGLRREAQTIARVLGDSGFKVEVAICKAGAVSKNDIDVPAEAQFNSAAGESMCNSVGQAALLDAAGCQFNVVVGLCVGHDTLFLGESFRRGVPATVLVAKDRVTGHNPVAVVYCADSYFADRLRSHRPAGDDETAGEGGTAQG